MPLNFLNNGYFAGTVGIGTESPGAKLEVKSSANLNSFVNINTTTDAYNSGISLRQSSNYGFDVYYTDDGVSPSVRGLYFDRVNNGSVANAMFIDRNSGNVGIGDTTPLAKLEVAGSIKVTNSDSGHTSEPGLTMSYVVSEAMAYIETWNSKPLTIRTYNYQAFNISGGEAMRIDTNRNVGINETSPDAKLHVMGDTGLPATSGTTFTGTMRLGVSGYGTVMDFGAVGPATGTQWIQVTDSSDQTIQYPLLLQPNGGNIGIGTITPDFKLDVEGTLGVSNLPFNSSFQPSISVLVADETMFANVITNGDFNTDLTDWTNSAAYPWATATWTASGVRLQTASVSQYKSFYQSIGTITAGKTYKISYSAVKTSGTIYAAIISSPVGSGLGYGKSLASTQVVNDVFTATVTDTTSVIEFWSNNNPSTVDWVIDNVSLREITPSTNQIQKRAISSGAFDDTWAVTPTNSNNIYNINSGNVGIGVDDPSTKLEVTGHVTINSPAGASQTSYGLRLRKTNSSSVVQSGGEILASAYPSNTNAGNLIFKTSNTSANLTQRMVIDGVGNVGIGDPSPQGKLEVNNRNIATGAALFIKGGEDDLAPVAGQYTGLAFGYGGGDIYNNASILWEFTNTAANGKLHFAVNPTAGDGTANLSDSKMTILDSGSVGIGSTAPISYSGYSSLTLGGSASSGTLGLIKFGTATSNDGPEIFTNANKDLNFNKAGTGTNMVLYSSGAVRFNNYGSTNQTGTPTYLLGTDASGYIVKTNTTTVDFTEEIQNSLANSYYNFKGGEQINMGQMTVLENLTKFTGASRVRVTTFTVDDGFFGKGNVGTSRIFQAVRNTTGNVISGVSNNSTSGYGYTTDTPLSLNTWHSVVTVFDGAGASNADRLKVYVDGVQRVLTFVGTISTTTTPDNARDLYLGLEAESPVRYLSGDISSVDFYNRALSASEVLDISQGSPADFADVGASGTELVTAWTNNDFDTFVSSGTNITSIVSGSNGDNCYSPIVIKKGKKYRFSFTLAAAWSDMYFTISNNNGLGSPRTNIITGGVNGVNTAEFVADANYAFIGFMATSAGTKPAVSAFSLIEVGVVASYNVGKTTGTWYDNSGNDLDGTVNGAVLIQPDNTGMNSLFATTGDFSGDIKRNNITNGGYIGLTDLPGYPANAYPCLTSGGSIHFANNDKYSAYLEGADTYFGILDTSSNTKVFFATGTQNSYLTGSGNFGVGITGPTAKLHVSGGTAMTGGWGRSIFLEDTYPAIVWGSAATKYAANTYDHSVDAMRWYTGAASSDATQSANMRMSLVAGKLGIGVDTPPVKVSINGWSYNPGAAAAAGCVGLKQGNNSAYGFVTEASDTDKWLMMGHNSSHGIIETTYAATGGHSDLYIKTGGANQLVLQSTDGNVLISSTSQSALSGKLEVESSGYATPTLVLKDDTGTGLQFTGQNNGDKYIQARDLGSATYYKLALNPLGGNVGIGTATPGNPLEVNGNIYAQATAATVDVVAYNTTTGLSNSDLHLAVTSSGEGQVRMYGNYPLTFYTNNTEKLRIASDGKIQVGSDKVIWAGGYGGALVIRQNNATGDRLIKMVTVDSTGAILLDNVLVAKGASVGLGTDSPTEKLDVRNGVARVSDSRGNDSGILAFGNYLNGAGYYDNAIWRGGLNDITSSGNTLHMSSYQALAFTTSANPLGSQTLRMYIPGGGTQAGNVGIGNTSPNNKLTVKEANCIIDAQSSADSQTVGFRAGYLNHGSLCGFFRYTTGDAQLYIDNEFTGNNGVYSDINFRNKANGGTSLITRMKIKGSTGAVGIGANASSAIYPLDVHSATASGVIIRAKGIGAQILIESNTAGEAYLYQKPNITSDKEARFMMTAGTAYGWAWSDDGSGTPASRVKFMKLDQNPGTLTVKGDVIAYGTPSDISLKENIKPIDSALDKVMKLQGVTFDWKKTDSILELKEDIGFIAQDVQKVVPELIRENSNGLLSMRHQGVAPILLEAIKELKAEIDLLKSKPCTCNKCNCNA